MHLALHHLPDHPECAQDGIEADVGISIPRKSHFESTHTEAEEPQENICQLEECVAGRFQVSGKEQLYTR